MLLARFLSIVFGFVLFVCLAYMSADLWVDSVEEPLSESNIQDKNGQDKIFLAKDIKTLQKQIEILETRISALEQQQFRQTNYTTLTQDTTEVSSLSDGSTADQVFIESDEVTLVEQNRQHLDNLLSDIETNLQNEPTDQQWVADTRAVIEQTFASEEFSGATLTGIECRTSLCRVELLHDSLQSIDNFDVWWPQRLAPVLPNAVIDRVELDDGSVSTLIYLARAGYDLSPTSLVE